MPRSDSADSQSQAIQEEPLPSTSNEEEDPLAGKMIFSCIFFCHLINPLIKFNSKLPANNYCRHKPARGCGSLVSGSSSWGHSSRGFAKSTWHQTSFPSSCCHQPFILYWASTGRTRGHWGQPWVPGSITSCHPGRGKGMHIKLCLLYWEINVYSKKTVPIIMR